MIRFPINKFFTARSFAPSTYAEQYNQLSKKYIAGVWWKSFSNDLIGKDGLPLFKNPPDPGALESTEVLPWWTKQLAKFPNNLKTELTDEHNRETIGSRKPGTLH